MFALGDGSSDAGGAPAVRSRHSSQGGRRSGGGRPIMAGVYATTTTSGGGSPPALKKELYEVPLLISRKFRDVKFKTLVGISSICSAAWYSVDDQLCIWAFGKSDQITCIQCDGVITSVDIGVPSPYCKSFSAQQCKFMVVVCTENSVSLVGLDADLKQVVLESNFFLQLPNATLFNQAQITSTGRVFLMSDASMPNTLVEMKYKASAGWFKSKCYFYYHSLLVGGGSGNGGFFSTIFSKLVGGKSAAIMPPSVANTTGAAGVTAMQRRVFIRPESSFKFFATLDSVNLNLHEFLVSPTAKEMALGSWRHNSEFDNDSDIRCVGRIAISDLVSSSTATSLRSIVDVFVTVSIDDSNEPSVRVVTESGEVVVLRLDRVAGDLIITRSLSVVTTIGSGDSSLTKRQKTTFGWNTTTAFPALGGGPVTLASNRMDQSPSSLSCATHLHIGGSDVYAVGKMGSTKIYISKSDMMNFEMDLGGTVQRIVTQGRVGMDQYGSVVVPVLSESAADASISPDTTIMPVMYILTGKGVAVLEPIHATGANISQLNVPETVMDVVGILSSPAESVFQYKAMCVRAVSDDVTINSLHAEQDYASREGCVKPLSGGIWIGGMKKFAQSTLLCFHGQPVLTLRKRSEEVSKGFVTSLFSNSSSAPSPSAATLSSSTVVVSFAEPVLMSVSSQLKNMIKFIRVVLGSCKPFVSSSDNLGSSIATTGAGRRMYMHGTSTTRSELARQQGFQSLEKLANELSEIDQVVSLLCLAAKYSQCIANYDGPLLQRNIDLIDVTKHHPELVLLCERLIRTAPASDLRDIVESLRSNCPLILCSISPAIMNMFSPESIASIIHCAIANKAPVHLLLESVRALGRNNAHIEKSLSEVGLILRSLMQPTTDSGSLANGADAVVEALLDGLQERLNDEHILTTVLAWCGTSLDERLNSVVFEYIFARGYQDKMHLVVGNHYLENFLAKRSSVGDGRKFTEVYAKYLVRIGKHSLGADVLEKQALLVVGGTIDFDDRLAMLELSQQIHPTSKRFEVVCIAKYVQLPLRDRIREERRGIDTGDLNSVVLSISELYNLATELDYSDIQLTCYLFVAVSDKDLLKTWVEVLFGDFSLFARLGAGSVDKGLMLFVKNLYNVSREVHSFTIWKRIEVIVAMIEYIHCQLTLSGRSAPKSWIVRELLEEEMVLNMNQIVEIYSKIVREMNVWLSKIPHSSEFSSDATPSREYLESYLADTVVFEISGALKERRSVNQKKLLSVLILLRNHVDVPHSGLEELIDTISSAEPTEYRASLPTAEGL